MPSLTPVWSELRRRNVLPVAQTDLAEASRAIMSMHRDAHPSQQTAWSSDFARDYERAFGHHPSSMQGKPAVRAQRHMPEPDTAASMFEQMTAEMQARMQDVERRHADALRDMQIKLERMSGDATRVRPNVPAELTTAFHRIEKGMAHLADRIADAGPDRRRGADAFVFAQPSTVATNFVFNPKPHQPVAPVSIDPPGGRDPWDDDQAEALAQMYECGETGLGLWQGQPLPSAAVMAHQTPAAPPAPATVVAGLGDDRRWLEERLANITEHVAQSIEAARPGAALTTLMDRVDKLEERFGSALGGLATKSDLDAMRVPVKPDVMPEVLGALENQIRELSGHIEQTHQQLSRLDAIEHHLGDLQAFAQASMDAEPVASDMAYHEPVAALPPEDFAKLADMAAERALAKMPAQVLQQTSDPAATAARAETQARIDAVHGMLNEFAAERRKGDQYTTGMLETVQEALIRLIDRVDTIEAGKVAAVAAPVADFQPVAPAEAQLNASVAPQRRREARRVEAAIAPEEPVAEAAAPAAQEVHINDLKDLKIKPRRVPISPAPDAAASSVADASVEPEAKPERRGRPAKAPVANSGMARRGIVMGALVLGLAGVAYVASLMLADRFGPATPTSAPATPSVKPAPPAGIKPMSTEAPASGPPGLVGEPVRAQPGTVPRPPGAPKDGPVLRLPPENQQRSQAPAAPAAQSGATGTESIEDAMKPRKPATVPETVNDDVSLADTDGAMSEALPTAAAFEPARVNTQTAGSPFKPMPGMSLDQTNTAAAVLGINRSAALAANSERLGTQARPASDFSGRFTAPQTTAPIATGSNPTVKAQPVSTGPQAVAPQAPIDTAVTDNVSETAELPPALVGPLSLRMAASKGDPSAAFEVATRLAEGRGIKQDFKQAMTWYQRSANKGFAVAQYRLGTLYERGLGTPVDANRAKVWYKRAADQGNVKAMHNMAVLSAGNGQTAPDYAAASKWFKDAAERGLADSQFNLGVLNESGLGMPKDARAAYVWFSLAARQGDAEATRRRDALLATLDADTLKSAEEQLKGWRSRPVDQRINDARVAGDQWRNQVFNQQEPAALPMPVPPEIQRANAAASAPAAAQAAPAAQPRVIKAPPTIR
jgi:localization factor PodJL